MFLLRDSSCLISLSGKNYVALISRVRITAPRRVSGVTVLLQHKRRNLHSWWRCSAIFYYSSRTDAVSMSSVQFLCVLYMVCKQSMHCTEFVTAHLLARRSSAGVFYLRICRYTRTIRFQLNFILEIYSKNCLVKLIMVYIITSHFSWSSKRTFFF
jgi:hypothetical protein